MCIHVVSLLHQTAWKYLINKFCAVTIKITLTPSTFVFKTFLFLPLSLRNIFTTTKTSQHVDSMYSHRSASRRRTFRTQRSRKKKKKILSQKLNLSSIRINKVVGSTPLRRFNICFHSKISKPKCPKASASQAFSPTTIWLLNVNIYLHGLETHRAESGHDF